MALELVTARTDWRRLPNAVGLLCILLVVGCSGGGGRDVPTLVITEGPAVAPVAEVPLAYQLTVSTNLNSGVTAELDDGLGHEFSIFFSGQARDHDLTILGLYPGRDYSLTVTATTLDDITVTAEEAVQITTDPLPADFPTIAVLSQDLARMEPGYTLMDVARKDGSAAYIAILDETGEVVWYLQPTVSSVTDQVSSGALLTLEEGIGLIQELNERGETLLGFYSEQSAAPVGDSVPVDVAEFHDDVIRVDETISYFTSVRDSSQQVADFPVDETDASQTGTVFVQDEPIIEFAVDGTIVGQWNFLELLKPTRIGYDGTSGLPDAADWADVNGVTFDTFDNAVIASLRHQDAVVKVSRATGELLWILGPPANWEGFEAFLLTPDGSPFEWQYHQHAPQFTAADTVLIFDNGNRRASPFTGEPIVPADANNSRAVEYTVNEADMTVTQIWEWGLSQSGEALYSPLTGDVDRLPLTGNTLIAFGGLCAVGGVASDDVDNCRSSARIIEVDTATDERVFDIAVDDADPTSSGYIVRRSRRLPTLYPGNAVIVPADDE